MSESENRTLFSINGKEVGAIPRGDLPLLTYLHEELGHTGTKFGCGIGECRACTVAVRHTEHGPLHPVQSCITPLRHLQGWSVSTIESFQSNAELTDLQQAFQDGYVFQCGYCTAGFLMAAHAFLDQLKHERATEETLMGRIDEVVGRHLCRCTSYERYHNVIAKVARERGLVDAASALKQVDRQAVRPLVPTPPQGRVFGSPYLELIRLLRSAAEVEHCLMVQYLYAAFSVRVPRYLSLAGWGNHQYAGRPLNLLGVAIEEMGHLHIINRLLVALGAAPNLVREQFPFESDLYPFPLSLEPLSLTSLARYVYVEAPEGEFGREGEALGNDPFIAKLFDVLGHDIPRNQIGSLYARVQGLMSELEAQQPELIDYASWNAQITELKSEGETEHFELFKEIFMGVHPAFDMGDPWDLAPSSQDYPAYSVAHNPSAFRTRGNQIRNHGLREVAWLGNLHYWLVCVLLDLSYRSEGSLLLTARRHMAGPMRSLGTHLAIAGVGMPFDPLNCGYSIGLDRKHNRDVALELISEIERLEKSAAKDLPDDYPHGLTESTRNSLRLDALEPY